MFDFLVSFHVKQLVKKAKASVQIGDRCTYVDKLVKITLSQVMEDRGIVKISQVGHILAFFVFGWIHLTDKVFLEVLGLIFHRMIFRKDCEDM